MDRLKHKQANATRRAYRVKARIKTGTNRPRLSAHVSNRHVSAQIVDDATGKTLVVVNSASAKIEGSLSDKATWAGTEVAKAAKAAKISQVAFDRGARLYHGRLKALAEAARQGGLDF